MKDKLENFILSNRDEFDLYEPKPGIWSKIEKSVHKKTINWKGFLWKAAAAILIFGFSFLVHDFIYEGKKEIAHKKIKEKKIEIPELREAEIYYTNMLNHKLQEIQPILAKHPDLNNEIKTDLSELDSIYFELKKDLNDNIANHEVVEAMIQNYRLRITILEDILKELKINGKNGHYENNETKI